MSKLINDVQLNSIEGFHPDKLVWVLSEIAEKPITLSGYAEIHSKRFRQFVHNYNAYLEFAERINLIKRDMQYYYDVFSTSKVRGYKFTEGYSSSLQGFEINYLPIVKKAARERAGRIESCSSNKHLTCWFNPGLTVDCDSAIDYLGIYYTEKKKEYEILTQKREAIRSTWYEDYSQKCLALKQCECKDPYESYRRAFISIDRIKYQEHCLSTDPTVNRFHSTITMMPSDFRNFLKYDGKELVCLDIRNSQAFFSLCLLEESNIGKIIEAVEELNLKDIKLHNIKNGLPSNYPSSSIILSESLHKIDNQEVERYKNLVLSGHIYDHFEQAISDELGVTFPSRKALKAEFFRIMYSSNRFFGQPAAAPKRVFYDQFPGIAEYFSRLKKLHTDIIPIILMRWESHAVLQSITKRISRDHPEVPLFTIHDGIATTNEHVVLLSTIICEELKALTGYSPTLKKEEWIIKNLKYYNIWKHR